MAVITSFGTAINGMSSCHIEATRIHIKDLDGAPFILNTSMVLRILALMEHEEPGSVKSHLTNKE